MQFNFLTKNLLTFFCEYTLSKLIETYFKIEDILLILSF